DHMTLKYLVNKPILQGHICQWVLLFQEFEFTVVVKLGKRNSGPDHLSRIDSRENAQSIEDTMPDAQLFRLWCVPSDLEDIVVFLKMGVGTNQNEGLGEEEVGHTRHALHDNWWRSVQNGS
ncbi:hypothetical protein KI387_014933, partial [Taxus chinensis]